MKKVDLQTEEVFGDINLIQSQTHKSLVFTELSSLDKSMVGQQVRVRARLHTQRAQGNVAFLKLRKAQHTLQAVAAKSDTVPKDLIKFIGICPKESIVDIEGVVADPGIAIEGASQQVEVQISKFFVVSRV